MSPPKLLGSSVEGVPPPTTSATSSTFKIRQSSGAVPASVRLESIFAIVFIRQTQYSPSSSLSRRLTSDLASFAPKVRQSSASSFLGILLPHPLLPPLLRICRELESILASVFLPK